MGRVSGPAAAAAAELAATAAAVAGVRVGELHELGELEDAIRVFDRTWSAAAGGSYMPVGLLRALEHSGGYLAGAFEEDRLVGALVALLGYHGDRLALHSHMLAVLPEVRRRRTGYALKLHQRAWALEHGIEVVTWTFDPLVSRNAYVNLACLGAAAERYLENFYGQMDDAINAGDESDRLLAVWELSSPRALAALAGARPDEVPPVAAAGGAMLLSPGPGLEPRLAPGGEEVRLFCRIPPDIETLRGSEPALAREWRLALRAALKGAMAAGYRIETFLRSGCYVLERD